MIVTKPLENLNQVDHKVPESVAEQKFDPPLEIRPLKVLKTRLSDNLSQDDK